MSHIEHRHQQKLFELLKQDSYRMNVLTAVASLQLPDCYIGAGFVRNLVWDHIHLYTTPTALNDIDVVYFDPAQRDPAQDRAVEHTLTRWMPEVNWQVRNQARMHSRNGHSPYQNTKQAISYWIEQQTAVAVRLVNGQFQAFACFGWHTLFCGELSANPLRDPLIFQQRVQNKNWLKQWPQLKLISP
ncbi:nucleotidyltransferase family protein [Neptunicella marina]|uniref:Nucleotidyltransferase family protein n=1 Tax=Neptunicella marina TaxID=2125989 RepID=A0A8J6ITD1_9ALTE|nr:nucleotidyltransferase family protein [Neptunicella marina]MBC3767080.1 nucleotidyltransferase family protein [Neptunicella marina]